MWHEHAGFIFCLFVYNLLLYFSNALYLHFLWDVFMWTGILGLYFVWQNAGKYNLFTGLHESKLFDYAVFI
jgi:hypothetical protein